MTLTTPRLLIRPVVEADAVALFAACSDPLLTEHTIFDTHADESVAVQFIAGALAAPPGRPPDPLAVAYHETPGHLVGCIGARWGDESIGLMEFGYWLARSQWGRGLMTEAVAAFVPTLFAAFPVERLQSRVFEGNPASGRVLEKCGFTHEGTLRRAERVKGRMRDVRMYSRLRGEGETV